MGVEILSHRVHDDMLYVEVRPSVNLNSKTIEPVIAKMQGSHLQLLDLLTDELRFAGVPYVAMKPLDDLKPFMEERDPQWFNSAANYLNATERALRCKHQVCSAILLDPSADDAQRKKAIEVLLDANDGMALAHGIACIFRHALSDRYTEELERVSASPALKALTLDLKGAGLTGRCAREQAASCLSPLSTTAVLT